MDLVNQKKIEWHVREILKLIGEDPDREGLKETPKRVAKMYAEIFSGLEEGAEPDVKTFENEEGYKDLVIIRDIPFNSTCEHHLVPFIGKAHVGYIPTSRIVGLSKIARVIDFFAKRPQVQERLTHQIADYLMDKLSPQGVIVVMEAEHMCMTIRGVQKPGTTTVTSAIRGNIDKSEFLDLVAKAR